MSDYSKNYNEPKKKVQIIAPAFYARKDVQKAIFEFCQHRETVPRYLEGFGKRPDKFDFPTDINNMAKRGATSFHCSEEIWDDPLKINTDMTPEQYNEIKTGWDFLIDIDSKYLDYSKIAAKLIIKALERHGIKNIGLKFSGSKGFHLIVPFKAFPKELGGEQTKDKFPEWPRYIAGYIGELIHDQMTKEILEMSTQEEIEAKGKAVYEIIYKPTGEKAETKKIGKYVCPNLKCRAEVTSMKSNRKQMICPSCNGKMNRTEEIEIYLAQNGDTSQKHPEFFEKKATAKELIDSVDIVLVASRHLFRAPYSLHEKTSLVSAVVEKDELENFKPMDADPLRVKIKNFMPEVEENEAYELLREAIDWAEKTEKVVTKKYEGKEIDLEGLKISEDMFPPIIKKIQKGIKDDGRKRALYIFLGFLVSLKFPQDYIEEKIHEWNQKNYKKLKEGYLRSQIAWFMKNKPLPPNYDKPIYKEFGIQGPPVKGMKNPINYTITLALKNRGRKGGGSWSGGKGEVGKGKKRR